MKNTWKDFFTFSRREQGGILVMLAIILALILLRPIIPVLTKSESREMEEFGLQAEEFMAALKRQDSIKTNGKANAPASVLQESTIQNFLANPFRFDPNLLSEEEWLKTGLNRYTAKNIVRYREKGGKFRTAKDLMKIYGMEEEWFRSVEPFISIEASEVASRVSPVKYSKKSYDSLDYAKEDYIKKIPVYIELNSADSSDLDSCTGIGPSFARRIISYRELLGGYHDKSQLLEIKGMDSTRYLQFESEVYADSTLIHKIDLNAVTFKEMLRHPYFEYYLVKAIFSYKDKKKNKMIDSIGELKTLPEIYPELYLKISQYLEVR